MLFHIKMIKTWCKDNKKR